MIEIFETFQFYEEYECWRSKTLVSKSDLEALVSTAKENGIQSKFFGSIPSSEIEIRSANYREQFHARGLNSRQRAVLEVLNMESLGPRAKIYAPEAITKLAMVLRGRFSHYIGSEFAQTDEERRDLYPIQSQDLLQLTFKNDIFDAVLTCDVLEHVPDLDRALSELARVLKPGGLMISTHPFTWRRDSVVKAEFLNGQIQYYAKPEYHGNPQQPTKGSLVFTVPGWDILQQVRAAGFLHAEMILILSTELGIVGNDPPFINVLRARKN